MVGKEMKCHALALGPGARFSKAPKLFGRISGDIILFVSSKRRRLEARNFAVILFLFPLQHMKRPALQKKQVVVLRLTFQARKVIGIFEKRAPGLYATANREGRGHGNSRNLACYGIPKTLGTRTGQRWRTKASEIHLILF